MTTKLPSDLEIARQAQLWPLADVAQRAGLPAESLIPYGRHAAKVDLDVLEGEPQRPPAKMIVVTAVTPTPLGEGKTTTAVGLAQGMAHIGQQAMLTLRQPSMGPTFGVKGGAAGGGYSQIVPMEMLNLHLTGDFHAVTAAHNLLAAMLDAHLFHGNALGLDPDNISWRRVLDINDRALRNVVIGLGPKEDGVTRQTGFDITAASEIMVILSLCSSLADLRTRLGRIVVGFTYGGEPVTAEQLGAAGAMTAILRDAIQPNLMQTLEHTPALIHAGPFGNIATGNSSVLADLVASRFSDYVITEAGFGADMGAERFFNVKCRVSGLIPAAAVLVVTVRALKAHSGRHRVAPGKALPAEMLEENPDDVRAGADNLRKHIEIVRGFGVSPVVAINVFPTDHESELEAVREIAEAAGARVARSTHVVHGGAGAAELARAVVAACEESSEFRPTYALDDSLASKLEKVATQVYGADSIELSAQAKKDLKRFEELGYGRLPVVIAKTHLSISSDPKLRGAPTGWTLPVREVRAAVGAGYVYAICGDMRTMPGLGATPAAQQIDLDEHGEIQGLF
ncbi:formate--tetrahydrofolate ligase [Deinococcus piscis]|uniref:Formate--tetrahydrofolate ligase n=1 Tax=Deinococcus piscis TaxID=394230 RepID=A0ABQ3JXC3_9DEIO|nr:formate--tetrahydrofolate ligase [Deinococcus piscis]GHF94315.1 formate--tetrahydrofolate ligase [Deinococcus piscis]